MIEWITLRGEGPAVAKWLVWARKQARFMAEAGTRPAKRLRMADGTIVSIEIRDDQAFIRIVGGMAGSYQFIGTMGHLYKTFDDDSLPAGTRYLPLVYAVHAQVKGGKWTATPLVSSAEEAGVGLSWHYDPDPRNTDDHLILSPAHQPDGNGIRQWYGPTADVPKRNIPWLLTQWNQSHPCNALGRLTGGSSAYWFTQDMGFDFGPTFFGGDGLQGVNKSPDSDWYCGAALHFAGERTFIIAVDVNSVFYCYPTDGYGAEFIVGGAEWPGEKANVPVDLTQSQACPWPAWATTANLGVAAIEEPVTEAEQRKRFRPMWVFDQAGTRAACIAAHRDSAWANAHFTSSMYSGDGATLVHNLQEDYPGLVEVSFTVEVTGPYLDDFTFSVSLKQDIYSKEDHRCPVAVGYALRPMGDVTLDELLVLEYEHYTDVPAMAVVADYPADLGPPTLYQPRRPNRATVASVKRENGGAWTEVKRWLAYYACYPVEVYGDPEPRRFSPIITDFDGVPGASDYFWNHFVYIAQIVAMDVSSLSFCVTATVWTMGTVPRSGLDNYAAEAQVIATTTFGVERDRLRIGHPLLKEAASAMHDLTHPYPDIASMTRFHLNATADYAQYTTGFAAGSTHEYATLTVTLGDGAEPLVHVIQDASEPMLAYPAVAGCPLFSGHDAIWSPVIFSYWDGFSFVRPGMRWSVGGVWQTGSLSFTGYPYGAVHHGTVHFLTLAPLNNVQARFGVHRSGSWSIFAGPFAAHSALMGDVDSDIPLGYEQVLVDRVTLRDVTETKDRTTSHIALLNQAFGKTLTAEDYHFEFRKPDELPEFRPKSDDPTAHSWHDVTSLAPLGAILAHQYLALSRPLCKFCFSSAFVTLNRYYSYSSFSTFPSPRMECAFLPPK